VARIKITSVPTQPARALSAVGILEDFQADISKQSNPPALNLRDLNGLAVLEVDGKDAIAAVIGEIAHYIHQVAEATKTATNEDVHLAVIADGVALHVQISTLPSIFE